jgi:5'-3' exonuclease
MSQESSIDTSQPLPVLFLEKYTKTFKDMITKLKKQHGIISPANIIFAKDCSRNMIWRMKHYPDYKSTRDDVKRAQTLHKDIFEYTFTHVLPQIKEVTIVSHPRLEADDCIALMVKHIRNTLQKLTDVIIITNDNDYVQLHIYNVELINLQGKSLFDRIDDVPTYIELKRIMGDTSDNIPAIAPKIGPKTAQQLINSPEKLSKRLESEECRRRYELNKLLVHFDCIPDEYVCQYIATI